MITRRTTVLLALIALLATASILLVRALAEDEQRPLGERARAYYKAHRDEFQRPESREIRHLLVRDAKQASQLHRALRGKGEQAFARTASKHSIDRSTSTAGGHMTIYRGESPPALDRAAFALKTGALSTPIRTSAGYSLVLAIGPIQDETTQPFSEVEGQIKTRLISTDSED